MSSVKKPSPAKPTKAPVKAAKVKTAFSRHSDEKRAAIVAFIKGGKTNDEAKAKFGVSAHFVGKLRKENKVGPAAAPKAAVSTKSKPSAPVAKGKPAPKAKSAPKAVTSDAGDLL